MEERERIAKELHDGIIQSLFAVGMGLQGTALMSGSPETAARIEGAVDELDQVIRDLRNYIFGLRPGILADRQLDQALRALGEEVHERRASRSRSTLTATLAARLSARSHDIVQLTREALSNVARHAQAQHAVVTLAAQRRERVAHDRGRRIGLRPAQRDRRATGCATCGSGRPRWEASCASPAGQARARGFGSRSRS